MYVPQSNACSVPNSETPVSAAQIQASQNLLASMANVWDAANAAFGNLVSRPDLNAAGMPMINSPSTPTPAGVNPNTGGPVPASSAPALRPVIRAFDEYPVPAGRQSQIRLESWPTMCIGNGNPVVVPTPTDCQALITEAPPMPKLTIGPVGGSYTPDRRQRQQPNLLWLLALGAAAVWVLKEAN